MKQEKQIRTNRFPFFITFCSLVSLFLVVSFLSGCGLLRSGKGARYFSITIPQDLIGLSKGEVIKRLGAPDETLTDKQGSQYFVYQNERGVQFFSIGRRVEESLVLELKDDKVISTNLIETGARFGFQPTF